MQQNRVKGTPNVLTETENMIYGTTKLIQKLTFPMLALRQDLPFWRANAWNISFWIILCRPFYHINSVNNSHFLVIHFLIDAEPQFLQKRTPLEQLSALFTPLSPDMKMHILPTVLHKFRMELVKRICLNIKHLTLGDHFLYSHDLNVWTSSDKVKNKISFPSLLGLKG